MSGIVGGAVSNVSLTLQTILFSPPRAIGTIVPDCTIEETGRDDMTTTDHPVEVGAPITDNAFKRPAELIIRAGWSNSSPQAAFTSTLFGVPTFGIVPTFSEDYVSQVYNALLAMQAARQLITIYTGKRVYPNMLLTSVSQTTDRHSEFSLFCTIAAKELIIVNTQTITLPPQSSMSQPQATAPQIDNGSAQPTAAPNQSLLSSLAGTPMGQSLARIFGPAP